ncbi:hypothetical protein [Roseomonas fluvialis]|uniref:Uncharacterized protein n=1 Tax=Roseomonas fluvialis TaxID=1750527 RepID=A0ABN6NZH6_9PROT|nr:hypothetical protein [Roseomonas fluvialis]BDG70520.1 hypothetical protein Rmf_04490 [Roseomonas fluvialis]
MILSRAAQHEALLATPPAKLLVAVCQAVLRSMIAKRLLEDVSAPREAIGLGWCQDEDGAWNTLRITPAGLVAIGGAPEGAMDVADVELGGLTPAELEEEQDVAHVVATAGRRHLDPHGGHAGCWRSAAADLCRDGTEGA